MQSVRAEAGRQVRRLCRDPGESDSVWAQDASSARGAEKWSSGSSVRQAPWLDDDESFPAAAATCVILSLMFLTPAICFSFQNLFSHSLLF